MDLNSIIRSEGAEKIQIVVTAKDLRELLDGAMAFAMKTIRERDEPTYYTREEVQELLHVSAPTLINYRKKGIVPEPVTIEGRVLYEKAAFHKAIEANRTLSRRLRRSTDDC